MYEFQDESSHPTIREAKILLNLAKYNHPNIIMAYDDYFIFGKMNSKIHCLILELFEEGNLKVKIDTGIVLGLHSEESAFFFFEQILKAVDFLHSRGIFHLDIKVKFNFNIKLF